LIGVILAIIYLATKVSAEIGNKRGWPFWLLLGVLHLIFQVAIPFLLVSKGSWLTWLIAAILVFWISPRAGEYLMKNNISWLKIHNRWWVLLAWLVFGAALFLITFINKTALIDQISQEGRGKDVIGLIAACLIGGVTSCVMLGWYLAVSLGFNGHNNEVGGATRIENFKQFIRIRLTRDTLSAYVIAVDDPQEEGKLLKPRIIDAFTLVVKNQYRER
jgi:hypothetical protein